MPATRSLNLIKIKCWSENKNCESEECTLTRGNLIISSLHCSRHNIFFTRFVDGFFWHQNESQLIAAAQKRHFQLKTVRSTALVVLRIIKCENNAEIICNRNPAIFIRAISNSWVFRIPKGMKIVNSSSRTYFWMREFTNGESAASISIKVIKVHFSLLYKLVSVSSIRGKSYENSRLI